MQQQSGKTALPFMREMGDVHVCFIHHLVSHKGQLMSYLTSRVQLACGQTFADELRPNLTLHPTMRSPSHVHS